MPPRRRRASGELETPQKADGKPLESPSAKTAAAKKKPAPLTTWEKYQMLLMEHPMKMNVVQSGVLSAAANVVAQGITGDGSFDTKPVVEQLILGSLFIAPIVSMWFGVLGKLKLHWVAATLVDQFCFSPVFNCAIFMFMSAFFGGGIALTSAEKGSTYSLTLLLDTARFPSALTYNPIHSTQVKAYMVWIPATLAREKLVPPHLAPVFVNLVAFVWNIIFSIILLSL